MTWHDKMNERQLFSISLVCPTQCTMNASNIELVSNMTLK